MRDRAEGDEASGPPRLVGEPAYVGGDSEGQTQTLARPGATATTASPGATTPTPPIAGAGEAIRSDRTDLDDVDVVGRDEPDVVPPGCVDEAGGPRR